MPSVWGRINREEVVHEQDESGEECTICYAAPQNVRFKPCGHAACKNCVEDLRRSNIFKADAGVKCPYCRTYVETYEPLETGSALDDDLTAANKAAKAAAAARHGPQMPSIQTVSAPQGISNSATQERWHCSCGKTNTGFRERCSSCNRPNPIAPASKETERKDILKCTPDEILALAVQKLHPFLDVAFKEAGMPIEPSSASTGNNLNVTGTEATVQVAISRNGLEKLKRVVKYLTQNNGTNSHVHTLLFHWFGNYTLQDLVVASSKLRRSAVIMLHKVKESGQPEAQIAMLQDLIDGRNDLLGALVKEVSNDAVDAALHKQGTYALQKVLESPCRDSEFVQLGKSLMERGLELVSGEPGIYVMSKLVEQLVKAANNDDGTGNTTAASLLLDRLCEFYHTKQAKYTDSQRYEKLRYDMLIAAIDGALPMHSSAMMALVLAKAAFDIQKKSPGRFLVKQLLKLQPRRAGSAQVLQNVVCHVGESFEQNLVELMLKTDDRPPHVVTVLMQELNANGENDWVEHLVGEMVEGAPHFKHSPDAVHILKESLGLACLEEDFVREQLKVLSNDVPKLSKSGFDQSVWRDRSKNVELREAALANGNAAESSQVSLDSSRPGTSGSQDVPAANMPSLQQVEAHLLQDAAPASRMLSLQQVEAQQAAEQLLQGQQQQPQASVPAADPHATFGSVQFVPGVGAAGPSDADVGSSSQVSSQSSPVGESSMKKVHYTGRLPSYIPPDEQEKLMLQAKLHSADPASVTQAAGSKTPPPGFAGTASFSSSTANGFGGPSDAAGAGRIAPSPDRGRQASGPLQYNPVSGSPGLPPSQSRYTPSQSPERPFNPLDPLAFLVNQPATQSQGQGHQRSNASAVSSGRRGRAYQPPSDGASTMGQKPERSPHMSPRGQGSSQQGGHFPPSSASVRPYAPYQPHLSTEGSDGRAAQPVKPDILVANVIEPLPAPQPPMPTHRREQQFYKPPLDRNSVQPPRGADVAHASQQPLPRSDSSDAWGSEAPVAAGSASFRSNGQVPFVQQQQNKQQPPVTKGQKPVIRAAASAAPPQGPQQRLNAGQGRGQATTPRFEAVGQQGSSPRVDQPTAAADLRPAAAAEWTCPVCTYEHVEKQAGFLACAVCGSVRK